MAIVILGIQTFCPKSSVMISHNIVPKITICWPEIKPKMVVENQCDSLMKKWDLLHLAQKVLPLLKILKLVGW